MFSPMSKVGEINLPVVQCGHRRKYRCGFRCAHWTVPGGLSFPTRHFNVLLGGYPVDCVHPGGSPELLSKSSTRAGGGS